MLGIIGSGNVGANTAFFIAEDGASDVLLFDIREGVSTGKALDLMEASPVRKYRTRITGTDSLDTVLQSEVVVLSAGTVRKPGVKREELFEENAPVIRETADRIKKAPPPVVIIVTEPVDLLTALFTQLSGMPRERVIGVGSILDATRLGYALSRDLGVSLENISVLAVGPHSSDIVFPERYISVSGVPVLKLIPEDHFLSLKAETIRAADFIVEMAKRSTAYYAPSSCIAELVRAIVLDTNRILPVSILFQGEYGIAEVAMSLPAVIGRGGVKRIYTPILTGDEVKQLAGAADQMKRILEGAR